MTYEVKALHWKICVPCYSWALRSTPRNVYKPRLVFPSQTGSPYCSLSRPSRWFTSTNSAAPRSSGLVIWFCKKGRMEAGASSSSDVKWLEGHNLGDFLWHWKLIWIAEFPPQSSLPQHDPFSCNELILFLSAQHDALPYKAQHSYFTCYRDERIQWFAYAGHKWRLSFRREGSQKWH